MPRGTAQEKKGGNRWLIPPSFFSFFFFPSFFSSPLYITLPAYFISILFLYESSVIWHPSRSSLCLSELDVHRPPPPPPAPRLSVFHLFSFLAPFFSFFFLQLPFFLLHSSSVGLSLLFFTIHPHHPRHGSSSILECPHRILLRHRYRQRGHLSLEE